MTTVKERERTTATATSWTEQLEAKTEQLVEKRERRDESAPKEHRRRGFGRRTLYAVLVGLMVGAAILFAVSRTGEESVAGDASPTIVEPAQSVLPAEPAWQPNLELLEQYLDPVGAEFRAMEPVGKPDYEMLYSIIGAPYAEPVAGPR